MREKKESVRLDCDPKTAAAAAASSVAAYFKGKGWKIISFFPNTVCRQNRKKATPRPANLKKSDINQPD